MKLFLKILLWVAIIAVLILLTLFIAMKVGQFESFGALINYLIDQVKGVFS